MTITKISWKFKFSAVRNTCRKFILIWKIYRNEVYILEGWAGLSQGIQFHLKQFSTKNEFSRPLQPNPIPQMKILFLCIFHIKINFLTQPNPRNTDIISISFDIKGKGGGSSLTTCPQILSVSRGYLQVSGYYNIFWIGQDLTGVIRFEKFAKINFSGLFHVSRKSNPCRVPYFYNAFWKNFVHENLFIGFASGGWHIYLL